MAATSAGLLLFRRTAAGIEVLLVHPGGPLWARKDAGAWSIPKGEIAPGEDPLAAAIREGGEELGVTIAGDFEALEPRRQAGGKVVHVWAVEADFDPGRARQQHLRDGVAAALRPSAGVSRSGPRCLVHARPGPREDQPRPGRVPGRAAVPSLAQFGHQLSAWHRWHRSGATRSVNEAESAPLEDFARLGAARRRPPRSAARNRCHRCQTLGAGKDRAWPAAGRSRGASAGH